MSKNPNPNTPINLCWESLKDVCSALGGEAAHKLKSMNLPGIFGKPTSKDFIKAGRYAWWWYELRNETNKFEVCIGFAIAGKIKNVLVKLDQKGNYPFAYVSLGSAPTKVDDALRNKCKDFVQVHPDWRVVSKLVAQECKMWDLLICAKSLREFFEGNNNYSINAWWKEKLMELEILTTQLNLDEKKD